MVVFPRCKSDFAQTYISTEGIVFPCCWIANKPFVDEYIQFHQGQVEPLNIANQPLDKILKSPEFLKLEESWKSEEQCFKPCREFCSKKANFEFASEGTSDVLRFSLKEES